MYLDTLAPPKGVTKQARTMYRQGAWDEPQKRTETQDCPRQPDRLKAVFRVHSQVFVLYHCMVRIGGDKQYLTHSLLSGAPVQCW